jgi:hypothetical protein
MEKGGKTKRTVKLTLSDKDSYDYTYNQDGATASITFGFGKEPFQYEVKKISKSLEPLKQDILDAFTIQGIKQHEYKGGFTEAIKHLDTKVVYEDNFAKGGVTSKAGSPLKDDELSKMYQRLKTKKDEGSKLDANEEYALKKSEYLLKNKGLLKSNDKMADGGEMDSDDDDIDYNSISDLQSERNRLVRWSNQYGSKGADYTIKKLEERIEYLKSKDPKMAKGGLNDGKWIQKRNIGFGTNYKALEVGDKIRMDLGNGKYYNGVIKGKEILWEDGITTLTSNALQGSNSNSLEVLRMAKGGKVKFEDKVKSIKASLLKRKKVSPKVQKDYGKTYSPKEAEESAKRIAGALRAKYDLKKK